MEIKPKWYRHEIGLIDTSELNEAIDKYGFSAYGMYCFVLEQLAKSQEPVKLQSIVSNARKYNGSKEELADICVNYGLFEFDKETQTVSCAWLNEVLEEQRRKAKIASDNGKRGGRPPSKPTSNQTETQSKPNGNPVETQSVFFANPVETQSEPSSKPNETQLKPNRIELNRIEQNGIELSDNTREKNEFETVEILEEKPTNLEAVAKTTTYPPTPFPKQVNSDNYTAWLTDPIYFESLKRNVKSETGVLLTDEQIETAIERFIDYCQSTEEVHQTRKDCRRHFGNWIPKKVKELTSKKLTTGEHNLLAAVQRVDLSHLEGK